jgi:hypothetical protein
MAVPTALLVFVLGFNLRASLVVGVLTWTSLFIGWGTYISIGNNTKAYASRLGVFDWILGRVDVTWKENEFFRRFLRDYTGMSLRGLQWTLPSGYVLYLLGYGWQYSLCGSEMGAIYALGNYIGGVEVDSPFWSTNFFGTPPTSELIWGTVVWYFLIITCMVQLVKRRRTTLDKRYKDLGIELTSKCFSCCSSDCKGVTFLSITYQAVVVTVVLLSLCSVVYYAAIEQSDLLNKMQTFTGLLIGVVTLFLFLGCSWGYYYGVWTARRLKRRGNRQQANVNRNAAVRPPPDAAVRPPPDPVPNEHAENYPLLPASDSEEEKEDGGQDRRRGGEYGAVLQEEVVTANVARGTGNIQMIGIRRHILGLHHMPQHRISLLRDRITIFDYYWLLFETVFYLDVFAFLHLLNGLAGACVTLLTITATMVCFVWNIHTPRFLESNKIEKVFLAV